MHQLSFLPLWSQCYPTGTGALSVERKRRKKEKKKDKKKKKKK
jgi:hypothetical protein